MSTTVGQDASKLLLSGLRPIDIAKRMGKDVVDIKGYLLTQVDEGELRLTNTLFSIPLKDREIFESILNVYPGMQHWQPLGY